MIKQSSLAGHILQNIHTQATIHTVTDAHYNVRFSITK